MLSLFNSFSKEVSGSETQPKRHDRDNVRTGIVRHHGSKAKTLTFVSFVPFVVKNIRQ
jgi:hypothetical protein